MRENLSQQTAQRLYARIVAEKRLRPGDKLPNEVELSAQLGVSRATLREAIRTLAARGYWRSAGGEVPSSPAGWRRSRTSALAPWRGCGAAAGPVRAAGHLRAPGGRPGLRPGHRTGAGRHLGPGGGRWRPASGRGGTGPRRTGSSTRHRPGHPQRVHDPSNTRSSVIGQAVGTAVASGGHGARLAEDTLRDHALLMEFLEKRDGAGAEHAMAIHIRHAMGEMELEPEETGGRRP